MFQRVFVVVFAALLGAATAVPSRAQEAVPVATPAPAAARAPAPAPPPEPLWQGSLGLSYLATSGNSDTRSLGADLGLERRPTPWGVSVKATYDRAEEDGTTTAERAYAGARALRSLGERWELFAGGSGEKDEFSGVDLRWVVESGGTYRLLVGPTHTLSVDAGLTWTDESLLPPGVDSSYLGGVAGLSYGWKIGESASLSQRLVYHSNFDTSDDWRAESETALAVALNRRLALKVGYEVRYRNQPVGSNDDTDTTSKVSLVVKL